MKKILFASLLAIVILLGVYGCSVAPSPAVTTGHPTTMDTVPETTEETLPWKPLKGSNYKAIGSSPEEPDHDYEINRQVLPETVDNPDGLPVLNWVCLVEAGNQVWNETAVVELNQMLADRSLPYRVQFTILSTGKALRPWDWCTRPEIQKELEDADLIYGYFTANDMEQWLLPITDYVYGDAQPSLSGALPDPLSWFSIEANGEIYGIPKQVSVGDRQGWNVDADFMEKYDLTVENFNRNFWEMDELFAQIYEKNGNQPFIYDDFYGSYGGIILPGAVTATVPMPVAFQFSTYQEICMSFYIDLQAEKPTVVNLLETDRFAKVQAAALRYLSAGYMTLDDYAISYTPFINTSEPYLYEAWGCYQIPCTPVGLKSLNYTYMTGMTGISAKTAYQEQALSLLESIITDDALRMQLCYGKEGRDYTLDGNVYSMVIQEDGSCYYMDYLSPQAHFFEFTNADQEMASAVTSTRYPVKVTDEGMTRLESYKEQLEEASFSYCPVVFDYSVLDDELLALDEVLGAYYPMFGSVKYYSEEYYLEMLEKLEEAGMSTVIAEIQRQLDVWIAEHPDWDPLERS